MKDTPVTRRNRQKTPLLNVVILMGAFVVLPSMLMTGFALAAVLRPDRATRDIALTITFGITLLVGAVVVFRAYYGQVKLSRLQTDFVSHISHELRTPLTSIRLFVDTLEQKRAPSPQQTEECLRLLSQETERLSQMVERILSYARMEAGRREYQLAPVKANDIAEGTIEAFKARHLMRPFSVELSMDPQAGWTIADEAAVTEALLNLLDNAVKYTGSEKKISLTTARHKEGIAFSIRDNGPGIARAERRRIFDQFYRIDNLLSRSSSGSGLGLAIARHIVSAHGGRIYVESEPGQGTMFSHRFEGGMSATILLVEDDEAILRGLQMNLEGEGYTVVLARNGEAALELATAQTPDLVLLDVMLPGLNGYEVLAEIRRRQPRLPVVMLTAKGMEQDKVMGLDLGADDYIVKPFSLRELLSRVKSQLRRALGEPAQVARFGEVEVNFSSREVRRRGDLVMLSPSEFSLLKALLDRPGRALSRDELISVAWDDEYEGTDRTVDNFIVKLRQKLDDVKEPKHFLTVRGLGYRFAP